MVFNDTFKNILVISRCLMTLLTIF